MCANFDVVAPRIAGGRENCACDGRKVVCNFKDICNIDNNCADLEMDIDFSTPDLEQISYYATYQNSFEPTYLTLDLSTNPEKDGIQGCKMEYGDKNCACDPCAQGKGVKILCFEAASQGCTQIDVNNFERHVPFFGVSSDETKSIAKAVQAVQSGASAKTTGAAFIAALFALAIAL